MDLELKNAIEASNKLVETLRNEQKADAEKVARIEAELAKSLEAKAALEARIAEVETKAARPNGFGKTDAPDEHKSAFIAYLRDTQSHAARDRVDAEQKAAQVSVAGTDGIAIPRVIASAVLKTLTDVSPIRSLASVVSVSSTDYVEMLDKSNAESEWVGELDERSDTAAPDLGRITPSFGEQHAIATVSAHALRDSNFNVEAWLAQSLAEKFASGEGTAFVSGNGTKKPRGILSAGNGFGVVKTGAANGLGANPHDQLLDLFYDLRSGYRVNGVWGMNSGTLASLAKVKDADGHYLYQPALTADGFDMIHGKRVAVIEDMPDIAAGSTPIFFGDLNRGYLIADVSGISLIVDPYTRAGFVKFVAAKRVGGTPRDPLALKLLRIEA